MYFGNPAFLEEISIGDPSHTKSFFTHNFCSLKGYPGLVMGRITNKKAHRGSHFLLGAGRLPGIIWKSFVCDKF